VVTLTKMKWDNILTALLVACALITTGVVVRREFFTSATGPARPVDQKPMFIENWRPQIDKGVRLGSPGAPVQLIEFADFECPFCALFHKNLQTLRERYPTQVALSFVHYPLSMHRFAEPAARAAECAGEQGHFEMMHDRLFEQQSQLGLKSWREFATDAKVPDLGAFEVCIQRKDPIPRVVEGEKLGEKFNIQGTPTLVVNGWKLGRPPSVEELDRMVKAILAGKSPVSDAGKIG
jgi:protein-disulfide isomerase